MEIKHKVRYFGRNTEGRDFVIGDLHGKFKLLRRMLDTIKFDYKKDRLFSVGDLIDRGEDSLNCLQLIYEPWFHTCIGNHEDMLIEAHGGNGNALDSLIYNGGSWTFQVDLPLLKDAIALLKEKASLVMVVDTPHGRRNIVHAEMLRNVNREDISDADIDNWNFDDTGEITMIWGRSIQENRFRSVLWKPPENFSITYCGHSVVQEPVQIFKHRFIDTGAVFARHSGVNTNYALTIVDLMTEEVYSCNEFEDVKFLGNIWPKPLKGTY